MKYKYIPSPTLVDDEVAKQLYRKDSDIFIVGWEVGHYVGEEPLQEWEKLREEMTLSPEAEEEWQRQQSLLPPTVTTRVDTLEENVDDIINGVTE